MLEDDVNDVKFLQTNYQTAGQGSADIYVAFIERSLQLLNKNGILGLILIISLGSYFYFRQRDNLSSRSTNRAPDSSRRDFRREVVVEPQQEQPTEEEVKSEPQEEQPIEEEVKSEPQEEQPPEDEKK